MTHQEWQKLTALIENLWKDEFDDARSSAYFAALGHHPSGIVREAVLNLAREPGGAFMPSSQQLAAAIRPLLYVGTAPWAMEQLQAFARRSSVRAVDRGELQWSGEPTPADYDDLRAVHPFYGRVLVEVVDLHHRVLRHYLSPTASTRRAVVHLWQQLLATRGHGELSAGDAVS